MAKIAELLERKKKLVARREQWDDWFQALADVFLPNQADFLRKQNPGQRRDVSNYENTHRVAARNFATTIDGLLKPKTTKWFGVTVDNFNVLDNDEAKLWLDDTEMRMWRAIYAPAGRFVQSSSEVDMSLIIFGTGVLWITENKNRNGLMFKSFHLKDTGIDENEAGQIDTLSLTTKLTKRQAIQRFGEENLGAKTKEHNPSEHGKDKEFEFVQLILPRDDRDARLITAKNMEFASVVIDVESEHIVSESGFHEFPAAVPRWDTTPEEIYGRSPAMLAYADTKTLQAIAKTLLIAGQKAADPATWSFVEPASAIRTYPGGHTVFDSQSAIAAGGRAPIGVVDQGANMPLAREMQADYRELVRSAFFGEIFDFSAERPGETATLTIERKQQMVRTLGPTFGRLEDDYIGSIITRTFNIMDRAGAFKPRPEVLEDEQISFTYMSPIQQARKTTEAAGLVQSLGMMASLSEAQPEIFDNFDGDEIARDTHEWGGFSPKYIRTQEKVDEIRGQRAQQQQEAIAAQQAQAAGTTVRDFALAEQAAAQAAETQSG